jgi:hypothetical protein
MQQKLGRHEMGTIFLFNLWIVLIAVVCLSACGLVRDTQPTPGPVAPPFPVVHVTADHVARAMEEDRFFSDYGQTTLRIEGTVFSVNRQETDLIIGLDTSVPTKVMCDLGNYFGIIRVGASIIVQSAYPQRDASRQGSVLMLKNCTIP